MGSGWTKHWPNVILYVGFYALTYVVAAITYEARSSSDKAMNDATYDAQVLCPIGLPSSADALTQFTRCSSKQLGLGMLIRIKPGQTVPIDGFLVRVKVGI